MSIYIDEKDKELYQIIGYSLNQWQFVELGLYLNFLKFLNIPDYKIVSAVFYSVTSFSAKLQMTENAGKSALSPHLVQLKELEKLCKRCRKIKIKRNHLAHLPLIQDMPDGEPYLGVSPLNKAAALRYGDNPPKYKKKQLEDLAEAIRLLSFDLIAFADSLSKSAQPPQASPL